MSKVTSTLTQLQRRAAARRPPRPFLIVSYGLNDGDDLYHGTARAYTRAELDDAKSAYQVIVIRYDEWPPNMGQGVTV